MSAVNLPVGLTVSEGEDESGKSCDSKSFIQVGRCEDSGGGRFFYEAMRIMQVGLAKQHEHRPGDSAHRVQSVVHGANKLEVRNE